MAFYLHKSNRTERLVDALAEVVARPQANVLAPEHIVVSSPGMERWLSMQLARRTGIWANPQFPFPRKLIETLLTAALSLDPEAPTGYEPTSMLFSVAALLREDLHDPRFADVKRYCGDEPGPARRLALSARLAELFDQYLTYRPELVVKWASGEDDDFQAVLLRQLIDKHGPNHLVARALAAGTVLMKGSSSEPLAGLPERILLFGISSLPPLYLDLLSALSHRHEIHLFLLSPSSEYFADQAPSKRGRKPSAQLQLSFTDPEFERPPHPLLASMGRHAREFQALLEERVTQYREAPVDLYEDPGQDTLLHTLQSDLLALRQRGEGGVPRRLLPPEDDSVAIHACHSPMRELEVLHDQLSRLISEHGVEPHEIIVMAPNITDYAKVIDAVFSQPELQRPQIAFRVADRGVAETQPLLLTLSALLDVLQSRFGANQVLDLLGFDLIRERFEIAIDQVDDLREWIEASEIRWGVDAAHREQQGQPVCAENTWEFGLSRLVLGYSTGLAPEQLFRGCSPLSVETGQGALLGQFLELCQALFEQHKSFSGLATASVWGERMLRLVDVMLGDGVDVAERKQLLYALRELAEHAQRAGFDEAFDLTSLRSLLAGVLSTRQPAQGFLASGVTFCQLLPMRSIPFKVLCLIGLCDGVFPKSDTPLAFDQLAKERKLGDRSRRDDDRQLFLEAMLSARERLLITYVGQNQRTNKSLPPSVLVQELIDHVSRICALPDQAADVSDFKRVEAMQARLVVRHPLSATSPRYFGADTDPRLFSFARGSCKAALASLREAAAPAAFAVLKAPLADRPTELSLRELERCLMRPARTFCQRRLNLYLGDDLRALPEREPFELDPLQRWQIATEWLEHTLQGRPEASSLEVLRARGRLPHFVVGALKHTDLERQVAQIHQAFEAVTRGASPRTVAVDLLVDGLHLQGSLTDIYPQAHARLQFSSPGSRHELRQFVRYVVMGCLAAEAPQLQLPTQSVLIARDGELVCFELTPAECERTLRELLALYVQAQAAPLPLFSGASRKYVEEQSKGATPDTALRAARKQYGERNNPAGQSDLPDAYVEQLFGDFDQMLSYAQGLFEDAARRLYEPLLQARRTE